MLDDRAGRGGGARIFQRRSADDGSTFSRLRATRSDARATQLSLHRSICARTRRHAGVAIAAAVSRVATWQYAARRSRWLNAIDRRAAGIGDRGRHRRLHSSRRSTFLYRREGEGAGVPPPRCCAAPTIASPCSTLPKMAMRQLRRSGRRPNRNQRRMRDRCLIGRVRLALDADRVLSPPIRLDPALASVSCAGIADARQGRKHVRARKS